MVNTEEFIKRLEIVLDYYGLNASAFADKIGIQRSSLSHLLSGRNKPSLDLILKIVSEYPEVDLYWILSGQGVFPKNESSHFSENTQLPTPEKIVPPTPIFENTVQENLFSPVEEVAKIENTFKVESVQVGIENELGKKNSTSSEVEKIVMFYKNGTFKVYTPN